MQPDKLSEKASMMVAYAKHVLDGLTKFESELEKTVLEAKRRAALEEVEQEFQRVMNEVKREHAWTDEEVYVFSGKRMTITSDDPFFLSCGYAETGKGFEHVPDLELSEYWKIRVPVETFMKLMEEMKTSILEGGLDDLIHLKGKHIIIKNISNALAYATPVTPQSIVHIPDWELVDFVCPNCGAVVTAPYSNIGRRLNCESCSSEFESHKTSIGLRKKE